MSSSSDYGVDIYQLNVGQGDSAIYIQFQGVSLPKSQRTILSVVLVDGGDRESSQATPWANIKHTVEHIKQEYGKDIRFDTIVITHWDSDHLRGVTDLILNDLVQQSTGKSQYLKYDNNKPKTYMYFPFWKDSRSGITKPKPLTGANAPTWAAKFKKEGKVDGEDAMSWKIKKDPATWVQNVNLVRDTPEVMLGIDFFVNNASPVGSNYPDITSLEELLSKEDVALKNKPGLLCIATDRFRLGGVKKPLLVEVQEDVPDERMTGQATTPANQVSIVTLVVFRDQGPRISYYAAGDLDEAFEEEIMMWTQNTNKFTVDAIKASHHGAAGSFPQNMVKTWKPESIVFSCGKNHGRPYYHPAWEIIYWISEDPTYDNVSQKPIWSTMYPYWLTKDNTGSIPPTMAYASKKNWLDSFQTDKKFTKGLDDLESLKQPSTATGLANKSYKDIDTSENLLRRMATIWDDFSNTKSSSTYYTGLTNSQGAFIPKTTQVWYILIECRSGSTTVQEKGNDGSLRPSSRRTFTNQMQPTTTSLVSLKRTAKPVTNVPGGTNNQPKRAKQDASTLDLGALQIISNPEVGAVAEEKAPSEVVLFDDTVFRIYAKSVGDPNSYVVTVLEQRSFIEQLSRQVLELQSNLVDDTPVAFQEDDEVYVWFKNCLYVANALSVINLSARGTLNDVEHFDMQLTLTASDGPHLLEFSTEAVPLQFKIEAVDSPLSDKWGILKPYPIMIFGLNKGGEDFDILIADIYKLAGFNSRPRFDAKVKLIHPTMDAATLYRRNAIWFMPSDGYSTAMRLIFDIQDTDKLSGFFKPFLGDTFSITDATITLRKWCRFNLLLGSEWNASLSSEVVLGCVINISSVEAKVTWVLRDNEQDMELLIDFNGAELAKMLDWLKNLLNITFDIPIPYDYIGNPLLRRISLTFDDTKCTGVVVTFQLQFKFGAEGTEVVVFHLTYVWPQNRLMGTLYPGISNRTSFDNLFAEYEPYLALRPYVEDESKLADGLNLAYLIPGGEKIPIPRHVLPTITSANVILSPDVIYFDGELTWNSDATNQSGALPIVELDSITLSAAYTWSSKRIELSLDVRTDLIPRPDSDPEIFPAAQMFGSINYDGQTWSFEFMLDDVYLATLYSFFDDDVKDGVMDMIENVGIDLLQMKYDYSPDGKSDIFTFDGTVLLGPFVANFNYIHTSNDWELRIGVSPSDKEGTIGDVMRSLVGEDIFLPSCVDTIKMSGVQDTDTFAITIKKVKGEYLVFHGTFSLGLLNFSFIQLREAGKNVSTSTKRVFKIGIGRLPDAEVPLVGTLPQVFDEMMFMWVDDKAANGKGLIRKEVDFINENVLGSGEAIRFKEFKPQPSTQRPDDLILQRGLHFLIVTMVTGVSKVILDHRFGETKKTVVSRSISGSQNPVGSGETTMAPMAKKIGPLSISNIGLQFLNDTLYIVLDATFELGPLNMTIFGFGLGVKLSGEFNLENLPSSLDVKLEGLAVGFTKPPLSLAGLFRHVPPRYMGGITVSFVPYSFLAAGYYGEMRGYKTVFVFAKLTGPLITLAFAEIWGICGGFGYNNTISYPTISQVPDYPFINNSSLSSDPVQALDALTGPSGWVQPKENVNWFAVGLAVKAFGLLQVNAVVAVEFNPYVRLGIFALAEAGFPSNAKGNNRFLYVGLGIGAVVDFELGTMKIEGQLTPNSFILAPSCHLTGGFGLFYWFGENTYAGDWVFTIGGYHPSYMIPTHYPKPPRLGISWTVGGALSITGESYFAITPKCCMAGGRLRATLSLGPLGAWFDAQTNMLINFDPFYFQGDVRVTVGVSFTLHLWIVTLYIKVEIGAALYIRGPPFGGRVYVNFWVFGFNIDFGASAQQPPALSLPKFWQMCVQEGSQSFSAPTRRLQALREQDAMTTEGVQHHVLAVESGLLPTSSDPQIWDVRGGIFSFTIQSRFPIKNASVTGGGQVSDNTPFYSKPMRLTTQFSASTVSIEIQKEQATFAVVHDKWLLTRVITNAPDALWGKYDKSLDPMSSGNQINALLKPTSNTISLTMSITVSSPKPVLAPDKIPKFNFIHAMAIDVNEEQSRPNFPGYDDDIGVDFKPDVPAEGVDQWYNVQNAWASDEASMISQMVLETWRTAYMWEENIKLEAVPPRRALDKFLTVYMAAPLMCKA